MGKRYAIYFEHNDKECCTVIWADSEEEAKEILDSIKKTGIVNGETLEWDSGPVDPDTMEKLPERTTRWTT